jgi:hypothetical protein
MPLRRNITVISGKVRWPIIFLPVFCNFLLPSYILSWLTLIVTPDRRIRYSVSIPKQRMKQPAINYMGKPNWYVSIPSHKIWPGSCWRDDNVTDVCCKVWLCTGHARSLQYALYVGGQHYPAVYCSSVARTTIIWFRWSSGAKLDRATLLVPVTCSALGRPCFDKPISANRSTLERKDWREFLLCWYLTALLPLFRLGTSLSVAYFSRGILLSHRCFRDRTKLTITREWIPSELLDSVIC